VSGSRHQFGNKGQFQHLFFAVGSKFESIREIFAGGMPSHVQTIFP